MADINENNFTVKEIVLDIRSELRLLATKIDRIDREGSIGTKAELNDQELRIRALESSGSRLQGAWATVAVGATFIAGAVGLVFGVLAYMGG